MPSVPSKSAKAEKSTKPAKSMKTVKHSKPGAEIRSKDEKAGPLSVDDCMQLIGWSEEPAFAEKPFENDFVLKDIYGKKIRLSNNPSNRPFKRPLADRYSNEHLRGKWALNLESLVIDKHGNVLQGQHRLVGLILGEQVRQLDPVKWGKTPLTYSTLIAFGADNSPENANTYDLGAKRSLNDVLYRHQKFAKSVSDKQQKKISAILSTAIRIVWLRCGGKQISFAPHFPHSEALEFYKKHPKILQSVEAIVKLDDGESSEKNISNLVSLGYAAALHYLMLSVNGEPTKVNDFWTAFASGEGLEKGNPILSLRQFLGRVDGGGSKRDEIIGTMVKAWLLWLDGKTATLKQIKIAKKKDGERFVLAEFPRIGGLDSEVEVEVELTQRQRIILKVLKESKEEVTYAGLRDATGLQFAALAKSVMAETKDGEAIPDSLCTRGLVAVAQYELQDGEKVAPLHFQLTATGKKAV